MNKEIFTVNPGLVGSIHYTYMVGSVSMVAYHATACSTFPDCITSERRKFSRRYSFSVRFPRSDATQPVGIHWGKVELELGVSRYEKYGDVMFGDVLKLFYWRYGMWDVMFGDILLNFNKL